MNTMRSEPTEQYIREHFCILGSFTWERGSINDNIRKILIGKNINYTNTFNGDILINRFGEWKKIEYIFTGKDKVLVYVKQEDSENEQK